MNKDLSRDAEVAVTLPAGYTKSEASRLEAPAITSTNQVMLSAAEVSADGDWTAKTPRSIPVTAGIAEATVPHASAVLLKLQR